MPETPRKRFPEEHIPNEEKKGRFTPRTHEQIKNDPLCRYLSLNLIHQGSGKHHLERQVIDASESKSLTGMSATTLVKYQKHLTPSRKKQPVHYYGKPSEGGADALLPILASTLYNVFNDDCFSVPKEGLMIDGQNVIPVSRIVNRTEMRGFLRYECKKPAKRGFLQLECKKPVEQGLFLMDHFPTKADDLSDLEKAKKFKGLARLMAMTLIVRDADINVTNFFMDAAGGIGKLDHGRTFSNPWTPVPLLTGQMAQLRRYMQEVDKLLAQPQTPEVIQLLLQRRKVAEEKFDNERARNMHHGFSQSALPAVAFIESALFGGIRADGNVVELDGNFGKNTLFKLVPTPEGRKYILNEDYFSDRMLRQIKRDPCKLFMFTEYLKCIKEVFNALKHKKLLDYMFSQRILGPEFNRLPPGMQSQFRARFAYLKSDFSQYLEALIRTFERPLAKLKEYKAIISPFSAVQDREFSSKAVLAAIRKVEEQGPTVTLCDMRATYKGMTPSSPAPGIPQTPKSCHTPRFVLPPSACPPTQPCSPGAPAPFVPPPLRHSCRRLLDFSGMPATAENKEGVLPPAPAQPAFPIS